ncbi:CcoQ/FixQ family Cbb3-type cytochrome c oxidase assembly chaperone [bacterium]|nr:CcoQ/FixQ family Cbb3-type cytochrome c oxidase assembly chaperone [bacterium]
MIEKELLRSIEGVGIFPLISLILFFTVFALILAHTFSIKKEEADLLGSIPFDNNNEDNHE